MRRGTLILCDACEVDEMMRGSASISESLWPVDGWIAEEWEDGPGVHLCPRHADPERRARLAEG